MSTVNSISSDYGYEVVEHSSSGRVISACNVYKTDKLMSESTTTDDVGTTSTGNLTHENGADTAYDRQMIESLTVSNGLLVLNDEMGVEILDTESSSCGDVQPVPLVKSYESESSPVKADRPQSIVTTVANSLVKNKCLTVQDTVCTERANLLSVCKLVVKHLIDLSLSRGCVLDGDNAHLLQFLIVMESILCHGLKPRKGLLRDTERHDCWEFLEQLSLCWPSNMISIRDMSNVRTSLGRMRAWLRLAVMQKSLADYFRVMVDCSQKIIAEFYEPRALMLSDEAAIVSGLLVGLNMVDCSIALKDNNLDQPMGVINYSLYLKEILSAVPSHEDSSEIADEIAAIVDQKNYLEEYNRNLTAMVAKLGQQIELLKGANTATKDEVSAVQIALAQVQHENTLLRCENSALHEGHQRQLQLTRQDIETERETYKKSQQGLDVIYQNVKQKLETEVQLRLVTVKELENQMELKQEMDIALRLLEKELQDKTDLLASVRKQLDEIKEMNIELQNKLQSTESSLQFKTDMVIKLEHKTSQMASTIQNMEAERKKIMVEKTETEEIIKKLNQELSDADNRRLSLEAELKVEKEWRATLQLTLDKEKMTAAKLQNDSHYLNQLRKEYDQLQLKYQDLRRRCSDQESTLTDLGSHLSESKLKMEDLKEVHLAMKEAQWAEDKEATHCRQCNKMFSVSRRKHHCRNCGEIFCNECSIIKMPLPSSAKPVRVCDLCRTSLQQRYSAN